MKQRVLELLQHFQTGISGSLLSGLSNVCDFACIIIHCSCSLFLKDSNVPMFLQQVLVNCDPMHIKICFYLLDGRTQLQMNNYCFWSNMCPTALNEMNYMMHFSIRHQLSNSDAMVSRVIIKQL